MNEFGSTQWTELTGDHPFTGKPALAEQADGRLQLIAQDTSSEFSARTQVAQLDPNWGPPADLGGTMTSQGAVIGQDDGRLTVVAIDASVSSVSRNLPAPTS